MRAGMQDVIDASGYALRKTGQKNQTRTEFDKLMGFDQTGALIDSDATVDMRAKRFVVNRPFFYAGDTTRGFNYVKIVTDITNYDIVDAPTQSEVFYAFITSITPNNSQSITCTFEIDWWHTFVCNNERLPYIYECYVVRDNIHTVATDATSEKAATYLAVDCGRGKEDIVPYEMATLESEAPYEYALANLSTFSDRDIRWIRFTFSQTNIATELFANGIYAQRDELGTGLVYAFLPLIPRGTYKYVKQVMGGATIGSNYDNYLKYTNGLTRALTLTPSCVSVELIPSAPFISKVDSLQTAQGNLGIEITYDTTVVEGITPSAELLKDKIWLIQTGMDDEHILPKQSTYKIGVQYDAKNSPSYTRYFSGESLTKYSHNNLRATTPIEPKLGQPQYSKTVITDNCGGSFAFDPCEPNGDLEKIQVVADYTGSTFKRKWYLSDGDEAYYMHDYKGRRYFGVNDKMNGYPLVNDAYIDYMNGRRNQIINGLAVSKATGIANAVSGAIENNVTASLGVLGGIYTAGSGVNNAGARGGSQVVGAVGNYASSLTGSVINGIQSALSAQWNYDAQVADLKEQANGVEAAKGNNAEFDVIEGNGALVRQVWRCSEKDTRRLVEYFHKNGYAVGEWRFNDDNVNQFSPISLDNMYYFDYLQATDINFYVSTGITGELQPPIQNISIECENYLRALFARGVRIWHGRTPASGAYQFFRTRFLNTRKEY